MNPPPGYSAIERSLNARYYYLELMQFSLFVSRGGEVSAREPNATSVIDVPLLDDSTDLVSFLTSFLYTSEQPWKAFFSVGQILAFHIKRNDTPVHSASKQPFKFPETFYPDQFIIDNVEKVRKLWSDQADLLDGVKKFELRRTSLTRFNVCAGQ